MTERSRVWDGTSTGDATESPYDAPTEFARLFRYQFGFGQMSNYGGVLNGASGFSDLTPSNPSANTVRIASGVGWVYGTQYDSDANVDINIPTPGVSTRIDRIVLRKSWAAQTIRLTRIAGTEGGGAPALVQTAGTTWDIPIAQVSITTGAVITLTDQREFPGTPGIPTGTLTMFAGSSAPTGWQLCDGSAISRSTFSALFAVIGTTYGAGNGTTTFNVPDMRSRSPLGAGTGSGLSARTLAATGGEETHVLSTAELASHSHTITDGGHNHTQNAHNHTQDPHTHSYTSPATGANVTSGAVIVSDASTGATTGSTTATNQATTPTNNSATTGISATNTNGSGTGHNVMHPFLVVNFIIKT